MRKVYFQAASLAVITLLYCMPVESKTLWMRCGNDQINLDMRNGMYQARVGIRVYNGQSEIDAKNIRLTINLSRGFADNRMVYQLVVNRNTLAFNSQVLVRLQFAGGREYWEATEQQGGQCSLMTTNYNSNRI